VIKTKASIIEEIKRIRKGYRPKQNVWYYGILYDFLFLINTVILRMKRARKQHFRYKCPKCGKGSDDSQVIFDCIRDHEYKTK